MEASAKWNLTRGGQAVLCGGEGGLEYPIRFINVRSYERRRVPPRHDGVRRPGGGELRPRGVRGHAPRRAHRGQLHLLRLGRLPRYHEQRGALEGLVPGALRPDPPGPHHCRHRPCQARRQDRHRPRLAEPDRDRGPDRPPPALQGPRRRHHAARLQHPEPGRHRLLREPRRRPLGLRPRGDRRDEPRGHPL